MIPILSSLLHMDGANNGSTFTDETGNHSWSGSALTRTDVKKFGTASGYGNRAYYLATALHSDFLFAGEDFTVESQVMVLDTPSGNEYLYFCGNDGNFNGSCFILLNNARKIVAGIYNDAGVVCYITSPGAMPIGTIQHVAFGRAGSLLTLGIEGVVTTAACTNDMGTPATSPLVQLFALYGSTYRQAWSYVFLDEFRVVKGANMYPADYNVPTEAYTTELVFPSAGNPVAMTPYMML